MNALKEPNPPEDLWCVRLLHVRKTGGGTTSYRYFERESDLKFFLFKSHADTRLQYRDEYDKATHVWHLNESYGWVPYKYEVSEVFQVSGPPVEKEPG